MELGYARIDITPTEPVPLGGYGNTSRRISRRVLSPLCSACTAFTDDRENTVLLFQNDLVSIPGWLGTALRNAVSAATGVPFENILIHGTHTHSGPDVRSTEQASIPRYIQWLKGRLAEAGVAAMADRKTITSAQMAKVHTTGMNFVRHYVLKDGTYKGDNFGDLNPSPYDGHATEPDTEMRLVKFHRQDGEDVILANWQSHPHRTGAANKYDISADIIGALRDEMEAALGCKFLYFSGAGGNLNPISRLSKENTTKDYLEQGHILAETALQAEGSYQPLSLTNVKVCTRKIRCKTRRPDPDILEKAYLIRDHWVKTGDFYACCEMAAPYGINSPYAAAALIRHHEDPDDYHDVPFTAISLGDLAFAAVPYEMFDTNGKYVRDNAPYPMTVIVSCANDHYSYVPSAYGYLHGCYEADCAKFSPGSGERFAYTLLQMLQELKM